MSVQNITNPQLFLRKSFFFPSVIGSGTSWQHDHTSFWCHHTGFPHNFGFCCIRRIHHYRRAFKVCWFILCAMWKEWEGRPQRSSVGGICLPDVQSETPCMHWHFPFVCNRRGWRKACCDLPCKLVGEFLPRKRGDTDLISVQFRKVSDSQIPLSWTSAGSTGQKFLFSALVPLWVCPVQS